MMIKIKVRREKPAAKMAMSSLLDLRRFNENNEAMRQERGRIRSIQMGSSRIKLIITSFGVTLLLKNPPINFEMVGEDQITL